MPWEKVHVSCRCKTCIYFCCVCFVPVVEMRKERNENCFVENVKNCLLVWRGLVGVVAGEDM